MSTFSKLPTLLTTIRLTVSDTIHGSEVKVMIFSMAVVGDNILLGGAGNDILYGATGSGARQEVGMDSYPKKTECGV